MEYLGIDIGGTGIKGAVVNVETGELVTERIRVLTPQPATPQAVMETAKEVMEAHGWQGPVGVGFPAAVRSSNVKTASNIDPSWIGINADEEFSKVLGQPTRVINDVDAAGLAEIKFGAGRHHTGSGSVLVIAVGTGIGSALFTKGHLVPNTELGHLLLHGRAAELYASNKTREQQELSWKEWGLRLNEFLLKLTARFWPDLIILGGGVSKKFEKYGGQLDVEAEVVPAELKNHAGTIGAAMAIHNQTVLNA